MDIISLKFVIFTIITLTIYHLLPDKFKKFWLLGLSSVFFCIISVRFFLVLAFLVLINFYLGRKSFELKNKKIALFCLLLNIGSFFFIKVFSSYYIVSLSEYGFFSDWKILLPIGFSYYILQLVSFQLDVHNEKFVEFPHFEEFALYLFYFPKLLSGPIEKPRSFLYKLTNPLVLDNKLFAKGLNMILLGLTRKLFISNILQSFLPVWNETPNSISWIHAICFVLYVYNDFAGYTLIVCGVSNLFGIELSPNFNNPLLARNFSEFWNRWHITLSTWLRENIYYPLSRKLSRHSGKRIDSLVAYTVPPLVTMIASGLWHKASLALILWGTILGLYMIIERLLFESFPGLKKWTHSGLGRICASMIIFLLYSFAMIPLAVNTGEKTFIIWKNMLTGSGFIFNQIYLPVIGLGCFSFLLDIMAERKGKQIWWEDYKLIPRSAVVAGGIMIVVISILLIAFIPSKVFIYQGF